MADDMETVDQNPLPDAGRKLERHVSPWLSDLLSSYPGALHGNAETRGLDSSFALATYVPTALDDTLLKDILACRVSLVILFGNAGDGKTAFIQNLARNLGYAGLRSAERVWRQQLPNGLELVVNLDGSAAWNGHSANAVLDEFFAPFHVTEQPAGLVHVVAINSGKLLEWLEQSPHNSALTRALRKVLMGDMSALPASYRLVDLNQRSLVGGIHRERATVTTQFLDALLDRFLGRDQDPWQVCEGCAARSRCTAAHSVSVLRNPQQGPQVRERLAQAFQACHQRGEVHITARELRAALSYVFFGVHRCEDLHRKPGLVPEAYWQRAFDATHPHRQGDLLAEMARLDPALEANPVLDRVLMREVNVASEDQPGEIASRLLAQARRRAWFERSLDAQGWNVALAQGQHWLRFRQAPLMTPQEQMQLMRELCIGIARLEDLPPLAFDHPALQHGLPLRITPRTPTESVFWALKPWDAFRLEAPVPTAAGMETLHTELRLVYRDASGHDEVLVLSLGLFHLLLELSQGVQLAGVAQEGVFAHLEVFARRLASEDARVLYGWHPAEEERVMCLRIHEREGRQVLQREPLPTRREWQATVAGA